VDVDTDVDADTDADTDVDSDGDSDGDGGSLSVRCGEGTCDGAVDYCDIVVSSDVGGSGTYECTPLPEACRTASDPSCDCFGLPAGGTCHCVESPFDAFTVQCRE